MSLFFITWVESDKAEIIEEMLDQHSIPIDMIPTPAVIREQDDFVFVCKDCFQVLQGIQEVAALSTLDFPKETRCVDGEGRLIWQAA